jgi:EAL domain-containing protein (putative c-di-GMP-specific phosphodiesterase class I)
MGGDLRNLRQDNENVFALSLPKSERQSALPEQIPVVTIDPSAGRPSRAMIDDVISGGGPTMVYQSVVDMRARSQGHERIVGYEALARFPSLTPPQWFEAASAEGLRLPLELACISNAIAGFRPADETQFLALNVSDSTLLASRLHEALAGIDPGRVILELSEAASIKSYETTRGVVESLATRGMRLAIDDIGSGEIDLWHISRLGTSVVKVDMTLVRSIDSNPRNRALVRGVTAMANDLGIMVVAEGIEREEEHDQLLELGVQFGQGYLYGKPGPLLWKTRVLIGDDGADGQALLTRSGNGATRSPVPPGPRSSSRGRGRSGPRG